MDETTGGDRPPGPDGLPFIGATREFAQDRLGFVTRTAREYGDVARVRIAGGEEFYTLFHPDHVRHVLVENNDNYVKGEFFQRQLDLLGEGVLNAEGEAWRRQRHAVEPAFHPDRIEGYARPMTDFTERVLGGWDDGEVRNVHEDLQALTLEIVAKALFDVDIREARDDIGRALETVMAHSRRRSSRIVDLPDWLPVHGNIEYLRASRALDNVVNSIIEERRGAGDSGDVVSMLVAGSGTEDRTGTEHRIDTGNRNGVRNRDDRSGPARGMSDDRIRDQVMTLLLAGHETTAVALTYTVYLLATHPSIEDRLLEELDAILDGDTPTVEDLPELSTTERIVKESMRLYPPVWALLREAVEEDEIGGYRVPPGTTIGLYPWVTHRDSRFYEDPVTFQPDRWTDSFEGTRHPFAYFPFGGGPRRCLGERFALQEVKLVVATLYQNVHFEALGSEELSLDPALTLRPDDGLDMRVHDR